MRRLLLCIAVASTYRHRFDDDVYATLGIVFITAAHTYGITMKDDSLLIERRTLGMMSGRVHLIESIEWQLMMEDRDFDSNGSSLN